MYMSPLHSLADPIHVLMPPLEITSNHSHGTSLAFNPFLSSQLVLRLYYYDVMTADL
jgi:hypothetical protein